MATADFVSRSSLAFATAPSGHLARPQRVPHAGGVPRASGGPGPQGTALVAGGLWGLSKGRRSVRRATRGGTMSDLSQQMRQQRKQFEASMEKDEETGETMAIRPWDIM
eukprot:g30300.t1